MTPSAQARTTEEATAALLQGRPARGPGHYLRDIVYGASDGAVTTLAVIAGVAGASLAPVVALVLGAANLVGDGISMAAANYLSLKSDLEQRSIPPDLERPMRHAAATFAAFLVAGGIPLVAYLLPVASGTGRLVVATAAALLALAQVGAWRARFVGRTPARSAIETTAIGAVAALAAFLVGLAARALAGGA